MISIIVEGLSGEIDKVYFGVVDNSDDSDWVNITSIDDEKKQDVFETINDLKAVFNGTGHQKVEITFDNMEGCPRKTQESLLTEFERLLKKTNLKYSVRR